ncbi:MAG: sulfatase [Planctomycetota bacterium]
MSCIGKLATFVATLLACQFATAKERPNVVLIITDDQNDYFSEASGVAAKTPAMDRLQQQSILFDRAYCASPVCGPSRAALFSGLYPHHTGAYFNGSDPWLKSTQLKNAETLPELFRRGGYQTWGMGKLFHAKLSADRADKQWDNRSSANGGFAPFADPEHRLSGKFFSVQEWDGPDGDFPDVKNANAAIKFLKQHDNRTPFLLVYGLWRPHNPWTAPRRFFDQYDPKSFTFPPPGYSDNDLDDISDSGRQLAAIFGKRWKKHGDMAVADWKRVFHGYLACTSFADWNLGRVIAALDQSPAASNTIVIVTSDNGYHVGEKHHFGKATLWEKSANVPMIVRLPKQQHAGHKCHATIGLIDLYPTLVSECELPSPVQRLDGNNLSALWDDPSLQWMHPAITTYGEGRFSLRSGPWRYIRYSDGKEELYDHEADPHELRNLANAHKNEPLLKSFRKQIPSHWETSLGGRNG